MYSIILIIITFFYIAFTQKQIKQIQSDEIYICVQFINIIFTILMMLYTIFVSFNSIFYNTKLYHYIIDTNIYLSLQYNNKKVKSKFVYIHKLLVALSKIYIYVGQIPPVYIIRLDKKTNNICSIYGNTSNL